MLKKLLFSLGLMLTSTIVYAGYPYWQIRIDPLSKEATAYMCSYMIISTGVGGVEKGFIDDRNGNAKFYQLYTSTIVGIGHISIMNNLIGNATFFTNGDLGIRGSFIGDGSKLTNLSTGTSTDIECRKSTGTLTRINTTGNVGDVWQVFASSPSYGKLIAGNGGTKDQWGSIGFYIPGDAFTTNGIAYCPPIGYGLTITSAIATVTPNGKCPTGAGSRLNFDIKYSSFPIASDVSNWASIMASSWTLSIVANSSHVIVNASGFSRTHLNSDDVLRLDIGDIGSATAGGSPICVTIYGKKD